jgi:hypothetical protein
VTETDIALLQRARAEREKARAVWEESEARWRQTVLEVAARSHSVRETAKVAGISPDTITQWRKPPKQSK